MPAWPAASRSARPHRRAHRLARPTTYLHVWLQAVAIGLVVALGQLIGSMLGGTKAGLATFIVAAFTALAVGGVESFRLSRRRDAATVADWTATRQPPKLPGD